MAQQFMNRGAHHGGIEGFGEDAHGGGVVVDVGRGSRAITGHEEEAGAQCGGEGAGEAVEIAPADVEQVEIAEDEIEGGEGGEPGEGEVAATGDLDDIGAEGAGADPQEGELVVDDEDPWRADGRRRRRRGIVHGTEATPDRGAGSGF